MELKYNKVGQYALLILSYNWTLVELKFLEGCQPITLDEVIIEP